MKPFIAVVLAACACVTLAAQPAPRSGPPSLLIRDVTLIDGTGAAPRGHVNLVVRNGRIAQVVDGTSEISADLVVNGSGLFAIPGLFDAHVHLSPSPWDERVADLGRMLRGGITSVYDVAGDVRETGDFARAVIAGDIDGPTIDYLALMAGPAFFTDPRVIASSVGFAPGTAPWMRAITPETDLVTAVAAARGSGASGLKLYAALDAPTVDRIAAEAHRQGMRTMAHATVFPAKPGDLVAAGVNVLAHAAYLVWEGSPPSPDYTKRAQGDFEHVKPDDPAIERLLVSMRDKGVALNPTLWIFAAGPSSHDEKAAVRTAWQNAVTHRAAELGITIAAGTDALLDARTHLPVLHAELEQEVSGAGLTPMQALVSATSGAAKAVGVDRDRGSLEAGKAADIVLLSANPLDDIRNTTTIRYVIKGGRLVAR
jgi:imidazolonepropionase-like amidohydrolase